MSSFNWRHSRSFADTPTVYVCPECDVLVYYDRGDAAFGISLERAAELGYLQFTKGRVCPFGYEANLEVKLFNPKIQIIVTAKNKI